MVGKRFRAAFGGCFGFLALLMVVIVAMLGALGSTDEADAHDKDCGVTQAQVRLTRKDIGESVAYMGFGSHEGAVVVIVHSFNRGWLWNWDLWRPVLDGFKSRQQAAVDKATAKEAECESEHAELHSRARVELLGTNVRDCGYNDCMVFRLRNNHHLTVTDVEIRVWPRDRWGEPVTRCGYYGGTWTWWRVGGKPNGSYFTVQNDEACFRGLGPKSSGALLRVMFTDGSSWSP